MRMRLLEEWNSFAAIVLSPECSAIQRTEIRRVFYAGAAGIMDKLMRSLGPDTGEPSKADLQVMMDFQRELESFARDMKEGRA